MKYIKIVFVIISLITVFLYVSNNWLENSRYNLGIDTGRESITILHLSDLHGKQFGKGNKRLIENVMKERPDIIVFTGDLIDSYRNDNIKESVEFLEELSQEIPVFYIRGNHEYRSKKYLELMNYIDEIQGIFYKLDGDYQKITIKGKSISILGLDNYKEGVMDRFLSEEGYKIILHHYPENFSENQNISQLGADLVLSGHSHGGQWRLPIIGGIYAPGQGLLPKYYQDVHEKNGSIHIISRGLGNSIFPFRIFNRPEVVTIIIRQ